MPDGTIEYFYRFSFEDGLHKSWRVSIDTSAMSLVDFPQPPARYSHVLDDPEYRCNNCGLPPGKADCPSARNLLSVAGAFADYKSFAPVVVEVRGPNRTTIKETTLQKGLQSLFALVIIASGCEHLSFLYPAAVFHLPFQDERETIVRVAGYYLLGRYLDSPGSELELRGLVDRLRQVELVNKGLSSRLRRLDLEDASLNAMLILDNIGKMFSLEYAQKLRSLKPYFP